jgi:hypothetical protein
MNYSSSYKYLPHAFLDLIHIGTELFRNDFKNFAPSISPQVDSFLSNPNCDCRNTIINFIENNREKSFSFLVNWFEQNTALAYIKDAISSDILEQKYVITEVQGQVFEIDDTPEEFLIFKEKMEAEKFVYRSLHLVKDGSKLKIYFL